MMDNKELSKLLAATLAQLDGLNNERWSSEALRETQRLVIMANFPAIVGLMENSPGSAPVVRRSHLVSGGTGFQVYSD